MTSTALGGVAVSSGSGDHHAKNSCDILSPHSEKGARETSRKRAHKSHRSHHSHKAHKGHDGDHHTPKPGDDKDHHTPKPKDDDHGRTCVVSLGVVKTGPAQVAPGDLINYTIAVTNTGNVPVPVSYVVVTDPTATVTPPLTPDVIAPGATVNWTAVSNTAVAPAPGSCNTTVSNTATVSLKRIRESGFTISGSVEGASQGEGTPAPVDASSTAVSTVVCPPTPPPPVTPPGDTPVSPVGFGAVASVAGSPTLVVRKSGPATATRGGAVTYRVKVTNTGKVVANNVVVTDTPPSTMRIQGTPQGATRSGRTITWNVGYLGAGESRTMSVTLGLRASATGTTCNVATVTASNATTTKGKACTRVQAARAAAVTG